MSEFRGEEIAALEEFAKKVPPRLPHATFEDKRDIIEALKFIVAGKEKVVYVLWHTNEFRITSKRSCSTKSKELVYTILRIVIA